MSIQSASAILERNGVNLIESETVAAVLEVRNAIISEASMTKDLEEQIDNITIAENIVRRSSTTLSDEDNQERRPSKSFTIPTTNRSFTIPTTNPCIEPITEKVVPFGSKFPKIIQRRETTDTRTSQGISHPNRYRSILGDSQSQRKVKGSLTSSSDEDVAGNVDSVDIVSFSSSGKAVSEICTQTPEDMHSSDEEYTEDEARIKAQTSINGGQREPSSSSSDDSASETEEWDSEADTHTSPSDEDVAPSKPKAAYYQVIPDGQTSGGVPVAPVHPNQNGHPRSLKDQFMTKNNIPWMRRPTFASMQFPSNIASSSHPRRETGTLPSSRSFPQDFCHMVSNPFFSISLHDAYQQACAFKEWYEINFAEQLPGRPAESHENLSQESHSSSHHSNPPKATSSASKNQPPLAHYSHNSSRPSK